MAFDALAADGYTIEKTYLTSSTLITDALARGEADLGMANTQTAWAAVAKGADIRTVVEATGPSNLLAAHERIRSCRDLDDKPVGVASTTGFSPLLLALFFERECPGVRPRTLLLPEAGARAAALLSGRVEATMLPADDFLRIERQSTVPFHVLMSHGDLPDIRIDALHVRRAWALEHPEAVQALIRAQLEAHRLVTTRPDTLREESVKRLSIDQATAEAIGSALMKAGIWDPNGSLTAGNVQSTIQFLTNAGALPAGLTIDQVSDLSHLDAVLDRIGRRR
jgi:ABC-type nitrate/sulfonate/bicarbonate transport system substrate-binding protein